MSLHPRAGTPVTQQDLTNIPALISEYYLNHPDPAEANQQIAFGTSGHRGTSGKSSFNEDHILAVTQALCEYRKSMRISGPLFIGKDTHALSEPAQCSAVEVFAGNGVEIHLSAGQEYTPTPVISHAILAHNRNRSSSLADGVVITPSHNPPLDGGFKYNPPSGGPAGPEITNIIQKRANQILADGLKDVKRIPYSKALKASTTLFTDLSIAYINDLNNIIDMTAISTRGLLIGIDPLGGAAAGYWAIIAEKYKLNLTVVNDHIDPTFSFMCLDHDGKVRMDCSSPYAMAGLIKLKDDFDIACGNDPDTDRHGIVTRSVGLMNPNHYLAVAIQYLFQNRGNWKPSTKIGKTLVSSSMIDRVATSLGKELAEVPVGFKWFVEGLLSGDLGFGGEESAGASFLRKNGTVWTTDKDGILLNLLAAEITCITGKDPGEHYQALEAQFGSPSYKRIDAVANNEQKKVLSNLDPTLVKATSLAGEPILQRLTTAPSNNAPIGGLKVVTENGWFAARPSGTEEIYKIYAESFRGDSHLEQIINEAQQIVGDAFEEAGI
jgi:phosphoglucomutase